MNGDSAATASVRHALFDAAKKVSKQRHSPMIAATKALAAKVSEARSRDSGVVCAQCRTSAENPADEVARKLALGETGNRMIALSRASGKGLELLARDHVQDRVLGFSASIGFPVAIQHLALRKAPCRNLADAVDVAGVIRFAYAAVAAVLRT